MRNHREGGMSSWRVFLKLLILHLVQWKEGQRQNSHILPPLLLKVSRKGNNSLKIQVGVVLMKGVIPWNLKWKFPKVTLEALKKSKEMMVGLYQFLMMGMRNLGSGMIVGISGKMMFFGKLNWWIMYTNLKQRRFSAASSLPLRKSAWRPTKERSVLN